MSVGRRIRVTGTVQGVGFRPFVYREAVRLGLVGTVRNDHAGVLIEVDGAPDRVAELCRCLMDRPPPLARIERLEASDLVHVAEPVGGGFAIVASEGLGSPEVPVGVDVATCAECLAEVTDPTDRRFRYPFANCTNCGPRYTIVVSVPYDRPATTMASFPLCRACRQEYDDPSDRRFHAQPNACPVCGPRLAWRSVSDDPGVTEGEALTAAAACLAAGGIVAVKGLGGYHLAVDATSRAAVTTLRRRKHRDEKPFAVMVPDVATARDLVVLDDGAEAVLTSSRRPIVLAPRRPGVLQVADAVAPGLPELGLLLAYTPLHHLLLQAVGRPLVMTSGNVSDEPIAQADDDAVARLAPLVDGWLSHNRPIHIRCDDSVVRAVAGRTQVLRRSRGYAPEPMALGHVACRQVLAVGAELKSTVSVVKGQQLVTSHHIGDLEHPTAYASFLQAVEHLCGLVGVGPDVVVHDLHPEYLSTKWALDTDLPTLGVQHHHAHVASCLAEHRHPGPVLGVAFDGLGYGCDRTLWGGEFLAADLDGCTRLGHLRPVALPGGVAAVREPWRMAVAWVYATVGADRAEREAARLDERGRALIGLLEAGSAPRTTSVGRLFDAVAALLGLRSRLTYEGQAAIELEALARTVPRGQAPALPVGLGVEGTTPVLDPGPLIAAVLAGRDDGVPLAVLAAGFHEGLGQAAARLAADLAGAQDLDTVVLTGGVFQNARLTDVVESALVTVGLRVLLHHEVPPNDAGISVGQAAIAAHTTRVDGR